MISATLKKLRYKQGFRIWVVGAPAAFEAQLVSGSKDLTRVEKPGKDLDLIQSFFTRRAHLERDLPRLQSAMGPRTMLWICYPKAKALGTDLNRDIIREAVALAGLETVAIAAIDPVWSALRCKPR